MKKILGLFAGILMLAACGSQEAETFKGYEYKLLNAPNDTRVTLAFDHTEDRYFGKIVNNYFGTYTVEGENITFGPAASTMMMGLPEGMEAESSFLQALPNVKTFEFIDGNLVLTADDDTQLVFEKIGEVKKK